MTQQEESALRLVENLGHVLPRKHRVLIIPHDYPDPDALAAAAAIHLLLAERFGVKSQIAFSGEVSRAENKELLRRMKYRCHKVSELRPARKSIPCILVDTAPWSRNVTVPSFAKPIGVIDHHQHAIAKRADGNLFTDIRAGAGATTTITYEYLKAAEISIPKWLAAVMAYAIASETLDLSRDSGKADVEAYVELATRADLKVIGKIRHAPLPRAYFARLQEALNRAQKLDNIAWTHLEETEQPEIVAEVADLLLRMEGLRWAFCTANRGDDLLVSIRSNHRGARCSQLLRSVIGRGGAAGGHHRMAAGFLDMAKLPDDEREAKRLAFVRNLVRRIARLPTGEGEAWLRKVEPLVERHDLPATLT